MNIFLSSSSSSFALFVLLCITSRTTTTLVNAEYAVKLFFNNGVVDSTKTCTASEWDKVKFEVQKATFTSTRRQERNLNTAVTASWCREVCSQMRYCTIAHPKCAMYTTRRALLEAEKYFEAEANKIVEESSEDNGVATVPKSSSLRRRELTWVDNTCSQDISILNTAINNVVSTVGSSCQSLLQSTRTFNCIDVDSCVIQNFDLWNADTDSLTRANFPLTGGQICESPNKISFQAVTNYCVDLVRFDMYGPNNYYRNRVETGKPYYLYGESGSDVFGETLQRGSYTMHALADGNWSIVQSLQFDVVNCAQINRFDMWLNGKVNITNYPASGGAPMCVGDRISFQAVANAHTTKVKFNLWGTVSSERVETGGEYYLYGKTGSTVNGELLPAGSYTMKAHANDDFSTQKEVLFNVVNCASILRFDVWDANTDTILQSNLPASGGSICSSKTVNFQAVTNSYARKTNFALYGPVSTTPVFEGNRFFLYGFNGNDIYGSTLPTGTYTLRAWLNDDYNILKEVTFTVNSC